MFNGQLFDIQVPAAEKLVNKKKFLLAHEQGCGKTVIALAAAEKLFELNLARNALIVCPTSLGWQWAQQIETFTDTPCYLAEAKDKSSRVYRPGKGPNYSIVPYSLFRRDYDRIAGQPFDIFIADEAQEFKNNQAKISQLLKRFNVKQNPKYRWALTGTAISNRLEELYSIFYWIDASFLPNWPTFEKTHIVRNDLGIIYKYKNLKGLNEYLQHRMDRRTHADLKGKVPRILEQTYKVEPDKAYLVAQEKLLVSLDKVARDLQFDNEGNLKGIRRDAGISRDFSALRRYLSELKLRTAVEIIERLLAENPENRIVVFSFYKAPLHNLQARLGNSSVRFTGDESSDEKQRAIMAFSPEGTARVLLASNAGSAGLDLPFANYVIHLDIPFSYGILDQRTKRITRVSSIFSHVVAIYLIVDNSIEDFYYQVVKNREKLAKAVTEGGDDEVVVRTSSLRAYIRGENGANDTRTESRAVLQSKTDAKGDRKASKSAKCTDKRASSRRTRKS